LGDYIFALVKSVIDGTAPPSPVDRNVNLGVPYLPKHPRDPTDRNRTSPFAFTGNKFEVRCVGASQRPAISNMLLNTITADSFDYLADEIEKLISTGKNVEAAIKEVVTATLTKHQRIIFEGNNYSAEWVKEAERRGIKNYKTTPEVLDVVFNEKNVQLLDKQKVMSRDEFHANVVVDYETYNKVAHLEAQS
jgi:glutamine synthetase